METSSSSHHSSNAPRSVWLRTTMTSASVVALEEQLEKDNMVGNLSIKCNFASKGKKSGFCQMKFHLFAKKSRHSSR